MTSNTFTEIPVINIEGLFSDAIEARLKVAEDMGKAARDVGFLYVVGHGIPAKKIAALRDAAKRFFAQSEAEKMKYYIGSSATHKGFVPEGEEISGT